MTTPSSCSTSPPGPWLTRAQAAARLQVSPATIDRYAREGLLPRHRARPGWPARYHMDEVDQVQKGKP